MAAKVTATLPTAFRDFDAAFRAQGSWWKNQGLVALNLAIVTIFVTQANNGYDSALISSYQAFRPWRDDLDNPSASRIGFLNLISYCCGFATAPLAAWASDRVGRRLCIRYATITMVIGSVMGVCAGEGSASPYGLFLGSRAIIGSGLAFAVIISPILLQELPHPSQRQTLAASFNTYYLLGSIVAAWTCFGTGTLTTSWSWRIPYIVQIGPAVFALIAVHFIPESPRFHMGRGDEQKALDFLIKYHGNGEHTELVTFEFEEMKETIAKEKEMQQYGWSILWATSANRRRIALVLWIGFCQTLSGQAIITFYYTSILKLVGLTDTRQVTGINGGLQIFNWLASLLGTFLVPRVPRRKLLLTAWTGVLFSNVWLIVASALYAQNGSKAAGIAAVAAVWVYDFWFNLVCGPLFFSYTAEILPFSMRAKGMMANALLTKSASIFNSYVNSVALAAIGWKYYCVYCPIIVIQLIGWYFLAVNSGGLTLEEIAVLFEPDGAVPDVEHAAAVAHHTLVKDASDKDGLSLDGEIKK